MKQEGFHVISELYKFLADFDPSAIFAASRLPNISENLRVALIALHDEKTSKQSTKPKTSVTNSPSSKKRNGGSLDAMGLLMDKDHFPTKQALQDFVNALGIKMKISSKDSQQRLARRIVTIINENPKVGERLYDLMGASKDSQTAGWIELIRRSS